MATGYAEAQIAAGVWKRKGPPRRRTRRSAPELGLTGEPLEKWVDYMAARHPGAVH